MKHADAVPFGWYEREGRNPWYNRETRKVELPDTVKHRNNFVLTQEEHVEYLGVLDEMHALIEQERNRMKRICRALEKGREPTYLHNDEVPQPRTIAHILELMVMVAKMKVRVMEFSNRVAGKRVEMKRKETP
jgi:hypothetical protein